MKKIIYIIIFFIVTRALFSQTKEYKLDDIIVSAGKAPVSYSNLSRSVFVINSSDIQYFPVNNIQDLLKGIGSVDLKVRGAEGVQADIGIRGGTFEQTLILIDGIKMSDPQTGHHNLNVPISLDNIERIEVLKGQGSRVFGPNAFGGAVNIITKKHKEPSLNLSTLGGEHNLYNLSVSASYPIGMLGNNISFEKKGSDGYTHNTGFNITGFSFAPNISLGSNITNLFFGYVDKKFGANRFYSDLFPDQWEHTTTKIMSASSTFDFEKTTISPKVFWRRSDDDYRLDNNRPEWYRNIHKTYSYGAELQATIQSNLGITSLSGEISKEEITSTNLGIHNRTKSGLFGEHVLKVTDDLSTSIGFSLYNYSSIGWKFWPGVDAVYQVSIPVRLFASYGKAFRIPTFTELFYVSPTNLGNPNLKHEETTNYEIGAGYSDVFFNSSISAFYKEDKNIIDWARISNTAPWKVENITNINTTGFEFNLSFLPNAFIYSSFVTKIDFNYTYLSLDRSTGVYESRYLLDFIRHQVQIGFSHWLPVKGLQQNWAFRFEDRKLLSSRLIVDTQINAEIKPFNIFVRASNLFNKTYYDFTGVILPGRWISGGVKFSLDNY